MDTLSEDLLDVLAVICHWSTYNGTHCRGTIATGGKLQKQSLCKLHKELIKEYTITPKTPNPKDSNILCDHTQDLKVSPRSYVQLMSIMKSLGIEDTYTVDIQLQGGLIEEADITNEEYILLVSDNAKYMYSPKKGERKAKDLKIMFRKFCGKNSVIFTRECNYCEDCYKKLKNVPKLAVVNNNQLTKPINQPLTD